MAAKTQRSWLLSLIQISSRRRVRNIATLGLVVLGPLLAFVTFLAYGPFDLEASRPELRFVLLLDLVYILVVAALVLTQVGRLIAARRAKSAGSRLHLRVTGVFALVALVPTVTVAIFAGLTINIAFEGWFSERVRNVVGNSLAAAEAYKSEQRQDLQQDARALGAYLDAMRRQGAFRSDSEILAEGQRLSQRGLREAYLIDNTGAIRGRGDHSYLFDFEKPAPQIIERATQNGLVLIEDWANNEFRALVPLDAFFNRYLYVSRDVDGDLLSLLDETQETVHLYNKLESDRGRRLFEFGLLYIGFAVILILASIWFGLWFAQRLSGPVGRLTGAAQRIGAGDLDVRVREEEGHDEISMLGRYFNQMVHQLKGQRDALLDNTRQIERRRRLFDSVLGSVTSGVVGLDPQGQIAFVNRAARRLLDVDDEAVPLDVAVPEFSALFAQLRAGKDASMQGEVKITRGGRLENFLVRMSLRRNEAGRLEGYVIAFDDVTDLVSAQRMAAWGDVARRIAHEIKNPLTPIQLSAERIKRKFSPQLTADADADADALEQMTNVIIRQTGDLRRIVDEFSKFARMPEPNRKPHDLGRLVANALELQRAGQPDVTFELDMPGTPVMALVDNTMIGQALTNLIKNAGESLHSRQARGVPDGYVPRITVSVRIRTGGAQICIIDNGTGLPRDRTRLFEPYVTTRDTGTGLGLPIVKKIIEEHGGSLALEDAPSVDEDMGIIGVMAVISLPVETDEVKDE